MRILGLDWGTVRVGAAISDPDGKIAFPLENVIKQSDASEEIKNICVQYGVEKIVIGIPYSLKGQDTASTEKAIKFKEKVAKEILVPVEMLDERFSTLSAQKMLDSQGLSSKKQRIIKDNIAAQLILQAYLDKKH